MTFSWQAWPTHFLTIWQQYGADGSEYGINYAEFGQDHHCGVDIKSGLYGEVMAVAAGIVESIRFLNWGLGLNITLRHNERYGTVYGHLSRVFVQPGDLVQAGQVIAWSGWTGNVKGDEQHLHVGQIDRLEGDPGCYGKYADPEPYYRHLLGPEPTPEAPASNVFNIFEYMAGDGRAYYLRSPAGQEACYTIKPNGHEAYQVKNRHYEHFWHNGSYVFRGIDTSPGNNQYYAHHGENDQIGAPWTRLYMAVGDQYSSQKVVKFYDKDTGRLLSEAAVQDTIKLAKHYAKWSSPHQFIVDNVIELIWMEGGEHYFYGKDYGLVGWRSPDGRIFSGIHSLTDERHEREEIKRPKA